MRNSLRKLAALAVVAALVLSACGNGGTQPPPAEPPPSPPPAARQETPPPPAAEEPEADEPQFEHDWQALYYEVLLSYIDSEWARFKMFNIYDLNGDGTPELLLSRGSSRADSATIYTVHNGDLIYVGTFGSLGEFRYDFERNYIHSGFTGQGITYSSVHHFENGEAVPVIWFRCNSGAVLDDSEIVFAINGEDVSRDVYMAVWEEYSFDYREDFIVRKHDLTQSEIERVLRMW